MPYAADGKIATDDFDGAIEISEDQYRHALEGMLTGFLVTIDGGFQVIPPPEPELPPDPTLEELQARASMQRDELLALATLRIAPLQDAADLGDPTQEESAALLAWKQYRRDVNRVTGQSGFPVTIDWPVQPA